MKILMVASEAVPFAKTGGLADVAGVLPRFIKALGHDIRVVMPRYRSVGLEGLTRVAKPIGVPMGVMGELWCGALEGRLPNSDVPVYFIEHDEFFDRGHLYNDDHGQGFLDNDNRYVFLSRAALQLCEAIDFAPDVVHVNDWHTAVAPLFLNTHYRGHAHLGQAASVLTIHNMQYQGRFYPGLMDVIGVGWHHFNHHGVEFEDQTNLLKAGLYHATLVNAVSPGYADEIRTPEFGHGLDGVVRDRGDDLRGILNGTDYDVWNPAIDPLIAANYDVDDMAGKAVCKAALQREMGLPVRDVPIFGLVTRLVFQKGVDIFARALRRLLELDVQVVLLGSGQPWAHELFPMYAEWFPDKFACHMGYSEGLAHRIEAGADFFVMPSRFEPCGLNQLYSLRYGTLPIVHAVGGLNDTVENFNPAANTGTGFKFYELAPGPLFDTLGWATHTWYEHREVLTAMQARGMRQRFSWEASALQYEEMYREAVWRRTGRRV